jgi:cation:H+ antiporter
LNKAPSGAGPERRSRVLYRMPPALSIPLWLCVVLAGVLAMNWGATRVCTLLDEVRRRWALPATGSGALVGLATATPELSVNVASVAFGWPDLGLGAALGSNVPALPLVFTLSYISTRLAARAAAAAGNGPKLQEAPPPRVSPAAVDVQVVPYLLVLSLLATLTLPPRWSGLQPVDGLLLLAAFAAYLFYALRKKRTGDPDPGVACRARHVALGVPAIAAGALVAVYASRRVVDGLGISDLVGGLFVIGLLCALPESFAAWRLSRQRKMTTAVAAAASDGIASLTVALVPPALAGAAVGNVGLYMINLAFLAGTLVTYIALNSRKRGQELGLGPVCLFLAGYGVYLAGTILLLGS